MDDRIAYPKVSRFANYSPDKLDLEMDRSHTPFQLDDRQTSVHLAVLTLTMTLWVGHPAAAELEIVQEIFKGLWPHVKGLAVHRRTLLPHLLA